MLPLYIEIFRASAWGPGWSPTHSAHNVGLLLPTWTATESKISEANRCDTVQALNFWTWQSLKSWKSAVERVWVGNEVLLRFLVDLVQATGMQDPWPLKSSPVQYYIFTATYVHTDVKILYIYIYIYIYKCNRCQFNADDSEGIKRFVVLNG